MSREILPEHPAELTLLDYLVGDLPPEVSDQIRRHVSSCRACRRTIADLSLTVDQLDRLPTVPIPHDSLADDGRRRRRRGGRFVRMLPALVLIAATVTVLATFRLGGGPTGVQQSNRVVMQVAGEDIESVVDDLLSGIPHRVIANADDSSHLVVEVADRDVDSALDRLRPAPDDEGGTSYTVDVGGFGAPMPSPYDD